MRTLHVLHLEDSAADAGGVLSRLEQENIDCTIERVSSKEEFQKALQAGEYDLILSDFKLAEFDGVSAFALAKELSPKIPFLLLSDPAEEKQGTVPFQIGEVDSAIKQHLQRLSFTVLRAHQEAIDRRERQMNEDQILQQAKLLNYARDAIFVRNLNQEITYWNKGAERIYGWTASEVMGKRAADFLYKPGAAPRGIIWKTTLEKGGWTGELAQVTKNGRDIFVMSRRTLLRDSHDIATGVLNINTDITEKREMESQIQRGQRMDSIGALAGGISHDLNNVLAPILMAAELLRDELQGTDALAMLNIIQGSAQRGVDLVKQILQFTQGTKGQGTMRVKNVIDDLGNLIRKTFPRTIILKTEVALDLFPILCDPTQLHQIILNLCVNARDAMPKGGTLVIQANNAILSERVLRGYSEPVSGSYLELTISDTGTGIPPEVLERIFEPFFTTKPEGKGTGLGLSTISTILRNAHGYLEVSSEVGKGTIFRVFLPSLDQMKPAEIASETLTGQFGHGEWLLLVDDELALLEMTKELLQAHGYQVMTAINGEEALVHFEANEEKIALVISDRMMPGIAGDELIAKIREKSPRTLTVSLSGSQVEKKSPSEGGADAFLQKPCSPNELIATVHKLLAGREEKVL